MKAVFVLLAVACSMMLVQGQGIPIANCKPDEHSVLYCPQMAEPDCQNPTVHELEVAGACDIPQCFCNRPTIRNTKTGKCVMPNDSKCPAGEHSVLYCPQKAEPDCNNPTVHKLDRPAACGRPQCFCDTPTLRNTKTGKCVQPKDC